MSEAMEQWILDNEGYVMHTYGRWPVAMTRGQGVYLWDVDGNKYLDFTAGIAVTNLGHCHPAVTEAIVNQVGTLLHCSNLYVIPQQVELAKLLVNHSCFDQAFFCNSGAEANEGAIKLARKYGVAQSPERYEIIAFEHSFHGRTTGSLAATGQKKYQQGFGPLLPGFKHIKPGDIEALKNAVTPNTCAVMLEPVQGEGGVIPMDPLFLTAVRKLCDENELLLIFDEVQTGIGRTGTLFTYEQFAIEPDILTLAKGLANGVPIGAVLAKKYVADLFVPGSHASTFGGNPLAAAAALATINTILSEQLSQRAHRLGQMLAEGLSKLVGKHDIALEVRGIGLMRGLLLEKFASECVKMALEKGLLLTVAGGNTVRFVPPLIIEESHIEDALAVMDEVLGALNLANVTG